jgi:hypothetical protein
MKWQIILSSTILILLFGSCKKKPSAGLGGQANLKVFAYHHSLPIDSCKIYIKFNTSELVSIGEYDISQSIATDSNGDSYTIFSGLKKGDYYIYGEGWDPSIFNNVKGGIPYTVKEETTQNVSVPVTEGD